ncbi:MAG: hypothetical protein AAB596_00490 [Patescibacteria group bacterium]
MTILSKKYFKKLSLSALLIFIPIFFINAAGAPSDSPIKSFNDIFRIFEKILGWAYTLFFIVAAFFIIIAAFSYLTAQGDPTKITESNKRILYAVIAIIVALLAFSFDVIISKFLQ